MLSWYDIHTYINLVKIVITGALGHIGSYVIRDLAYSFPSSQIILVDNLLTQRYSSLFNLPSIGSYQFLEQDITKADLKTIFSGATHVIHLAALTDAAGTVGRAEELEANNYISTELVAKACIDTNSRLISISSTSVYGTQKSLVSEECSTNDLKPQSPYAVTKLREEAFLSDLAARSSLQYVSCRFGTIYGSSPGMRFHTAVNKFCWQAAQGIPISIWETAYNQKRPYLHLSDASNAIQHIIKNDLFDANLYNILTQNLTVKEVVDVIKLFIPDLSIQFVKSPIMNQLSYEVSTEKFLATGFTYTGSIVKGIADTLSQLKNIRSLT